MTPAAIASTSLAFTGAPALRMHPLGRTIQPIDDERCHEEQDDRPVGRVGEAIARARVSCAERCLLDMSPGYVSWVCLLR